MKNSALPDVGVVDEDLIDAKNLIRRIGRGAPVILGLAALGLAIGVGTALASRIRTAPSSVLRFSWPTEPVSAGNSVQPDDLRSVKVLEEAARRAGLANPERAGLELRNAITVRGVIPPAVAKERDKQRALGQVPAPFRPTDYEAILAPADGLPLADAQRETVLTEAVKRIADLYQQTADDLPAHLGHVFADLEIAEYYEYGAAVKAEVVGLKARLTPRLALPGNDAARALARRLDTFELRFHLLADELAAADLVKDPELALEQARLRHAILFAEEQQLRIKEQSFAEIFDRYFSAAAKERAGSVQASDSLIVQLAETRAALKRVNLEQQRLQKRVENLHIQIKGSTPELTALKARVAELEAVYDNLVTRVRETIAQKPAASGNPGAIAITQPAFTPGSTLAAGRAAVLGLLAGASLGLAISLLRPVPAAPK